MPLFSYIAIDKEGKQKEGTLEVGSQNEAISRIKEMGFYPTQVAEERFSRRGEEAKKEEGGQKGGRYQPGLANGEHQGALSVHKTVGGFD